MTEFTPTSPPKLGPQVDPKPFQEPSKIYQTQKKLFVPQLASTGDNDVIPLLSMSDGPLTHSLIATCLSLIMSVINGARVIHQWSW